MRIFFISNFLICSFFSYSWFGEDFNSYYLRRQNQNPKVTSKTSQTLHEIRQQLGIYALWDAWKMLGAQTAPGAGLELNVWDKFDKSEHGKMVSQVIEGLVPGVSIDREFGNCQPGSIINISVEPSGSEGFDLFLNQIKGCIEKGSLIIWAAGNDGVLYGTDYFTRALVDLYRQLHHDKRIRGALLVVGAGADYSDKAGLARDFYLSVLLERDYLTLRKKEDFKQVSGTSFVAPIVSASLLLLKNIAFKRGIFLDSKQLAALLLESADEAEFDTDLDLLELTHTISFNQTIQLEPKDIVGKGYVNLAKALRVLEEEMCFLDPQPWSHHKEDEAIKSLVAGYNFIQPIETANLSSMIEVILEEPNASYPHYLINWMRVLNRKAQFYLAAQNKNLQSFKRMPSEKQVQLIGSLQKNSAVVIKLILEVLFLDFFLKDFLPSNYEQIYFTENLDRFSLLQALKQAFQSCTAVHTKENCRKILNLLIFQTLEHTDHLKNIVKTLTYSKEDFKDFILYDFGE